MVQDLCDRVVLLTGAAGGIGRSLVRQLSARGARLALADRSPGIEALADEVGATAHQLDLCDRDALARLVPEVVEAHGELAVLICNAGLTVHGAFRELDADDIDLVLEVDLRSALQLVRHALPALRRARGQVVLISSMAGLQPFPFQVVYSAAKHGLRAAGEALRMELAVDGVGVSTVLPGTIATDFIAHGRSHDPATSARMRTLMRRWGTPPDRVARAVVRAIERDRGRVRVGLDCQLVAMLAHVCPPLIPGLLRLAAHRHLTGSSTS